MSLPNLTTSLTTTAMLAPREQDLSPEAVVDAVKSMIYGGGFNATYEGDYGNDEHHVLRVSFSDMPSACLCVERPRHHEEDEVILARVEAERAALDRLGAVDFHWSARLFDASLSFDNPVGYPFLVFDFTGEERLCWSDESPGQPARSNLLAKLAGIQLQLIQRTLETREMTALEYFEQKIQRRLEQIRQGNLPELAEQDVLDQLALLPRVLGDDKDSRQFAMEHGDLRAESIISSKQFNIEAIVDWASAEMVPVVQAARLPPLLWCSETADDVPSEAMVADRAPYVAALARAVAEADGPAEEVAAAARAMRRAQTGPDVDFRNAFLESIRSEDMFVSLAAAGWMLPYSTLYGED